MKTKKKCLEHFHPVSEKAFGSHPSHRHTRLQASTHSLSAGLLSVAVELPVLHLRVSGVISCGFVCWAAFTEQNVSTQVVAC